MSTENSQPSVADLQRFFYRAFDKGGVLVAVDLSKPGCELPLSATRNSKHLVLHYDQTPVIPITNLVADKDGIRAVLSFERTPYRTFVPWENVLAMRVADSCNKTTSKPPRPEVQRHLKLVP